MIKALENILDGIKEWANSKFLTGFTETDPTVPSWAKESTKPAYDCSEIKTSEDIPSSGDVVIPSGTSTNSALQTIFTKTTNCYTKTETDDLLSGKSNTGHTHVKSDITDLSLDWNDITGKPDTFKPDAHTHEISEVNGLDTELSGLQTSISSKFDDASDNTKLWINQEAYLGNIEVPKFDTYTTLNWDTSSKSWVNGSSHSTKMYYNQLMSQYSYKVNYDIYDTTAYTETVRFNFQVKVDTIFKVLLCQDWDWTDSVDDHGTKCPSWGSAAGSAEYDYSYVDSSSQSVFYNDGGGYNNIKSNSDGWANVIWRIGDWTEVSGVKIPNIKIYYTVGQNDEIN